MTSRLLIRPWLAQAWCEDAAGDVQPSTASEDAQLDDWLAATDSSQLTGPPQHPTPLADSDILFQDSDTNVPQSAEDTVAAGEQQNESCSTHDEQSSGSEAGSEGDGQGLGFFRRGGEVSDSTGQDEGDLSSDTTSSHIACALVLAFAGLHTRPEASCAVAGLAQQTAWLIRT